MRKALKIAGSTVFVLFLSGSLLLYGSRSRHWCWGIGICDHGGRAVSAYFRNPLPGVSLYPPFEKAA